MSVLEEEEKDGEGDALTQLLGMMDLTREN